MSSFCSLYNCLPPAALELQAVQFFTLLEEGELRRIRHRDENLNELLSIQAINVGNHDYYSKTFERLRNRLYKAELPEEPRADRLKKEINAASVDASNMFTGIFGGSNVRH